jgi:DnaA family protein
MKQIPLAIGPLAEPTFDNFLAGPNGAACAQLLALADAGPLAASPAAPAPLYLWGPAGAGKTHLLRALNQRLQAAGLAVGWFDAATPQPWHWSPDWHSVVIDRCDMLNAPAQHAAFALFVEAAAHGTQVAAAGRLPPVDLALREDLKSRLAWGHVLALQTLGDAETRALLRRQADHRGLLLPDEVLDYLLTRFERNLGYLMRLLDALDAYGLVHGRHITVPLVRALLAEPELAPQPDETTTA